MARFVYTSRGKKIDMDQLSGNKSVQEKASVEIPAKNNDFKPKALNIKGHKPSMITEVSENASYAMQGLTPPTKEIKTETNPEQKKHKSTTDYTKTEIKATENTKNLKRGIEGANDVLKGILTDLDKTTKNIVDDEE